jgi:hypothetical protein
VFKVLGLNTNNPDSFGINEDEKRIFWSILDFIVQFQLNKKASSADFPLFAKKQDGLCPKNCKVLWVQRHILQ